MTLHSLDHKACAECASRPHCLLGRQDRGARSAWEPYIRERRFPRGEVLQSQGTALPVVQVVKIGTVLLQRSGSDGVEHPIGLAGCGQTLGTPGLLEQPADLSCVAVLPGRVCEIDVQALIRNDLLTREALLDLAQEQLRAYALLSDWARILRVRGATGQLAGALLLLADLQRSTLVRLPSHSVLAALLATTRETVARSITQLTRLQGLLRRDRWHCEIVRDKLLELAQGQPAPRAAKPAGAERPAKPPVEALGPAARAPANESARLPSVRPLPARNLPSTAPRPRTATVRVA